MNPFWLFNFIAIVAMILSRKLWDLDSVPWQSVHINASRAVWTANELTQATISHITASHERASSFPIYQALLVRRKYRWNQRHLTTIRYIYIKMRIGTVTRLPLGMMNHLSSDDLGECIGRTRYHKSLWKINHLKKKETRIHYAHCTIRKLSKIIGWCFWIWRK